MSVFTLPATLDLTFPALSYFEAKSSTRLLTRVIDLVRMAHEFALSMK